MGAPLRFVGRDRDRAVLAGAIEDDVPLAILGEAGVGKTTLVRAGAAIGGRRLREGGALALLSWSPYLAVERALGRPVIGNDAAFVAADMIMATGPDILFLDDLQWANRSTLDLLPRLAGRMTLVIAVRTDDAGTRMALDAATDAGFRVHELRPLEADPALEMIEALRPDLAPAERLAIARVSGGNPFYVEELCRVGGAGPVLESAVRVRLSGLAPEELEGLVLLARAERPLPLFDVGPVASTLLERGLAASPESGAVTVRHELVGRAAVEAIDQIRLRAIDRRLADLVDTPAEAVRHHLRAGDRESALFKAMAAVTASSSAEERATHLALAAQAAEPPLVHDLALDAVEALLDAERNAEALAQLPAERDVPDRLKPRRALLAAICLRNDGRPQDARAAADAGLRLPGLDPKSEVGLRVELARATVSTAGASEAIDLAASALDRARAVGAHLAAAQVAVGVARLLAGHDGWEEFLLAGLADARRTGDLEAESNAASTLIFSLLRDGRPADALRLVADVARRAAELRLGSWLATARWWPIGLGWHLGRFREAIDAAIALEADVPEASSDFYHAQLLIDLGRFDEARVRVDRFLASEPPGEFRGAEALWLAADLAIASGRHRDALGHAARHASDYPLAGHRPFVVVSHAWAAFELGVPVPTLGERAHLGLLEGAWPEVAGVGALAEDRTTDAVASFDAATMAWRGRHARGALRTRWAAAEALRRVGSVSDARARLLELEEEVVAAGALGHLARVERSLRGCGVRRAATRRREATTGLTGREVEVLRLIGAGLRDREIATRLGVSRWAITRAVESASAKLGAATRAQAVARITP